MPSKNPETEEDEGQASFGIILEYFKDFLKCT